MIEGTTPSQKFGLPVSPESIEVIYITYVQNDKVILEKSKDDIEFLETIVDKEKKYIALVQLTQADTLKFNSKTRNIEIQMAIRQKSGNVIKSKPCKTSVEKAFKKGEI